MNKASLILLFFLAIQLLNSGCLLDTEDSSLVRSIVVTPAEIPKSETSETSKTVTVVVQLDKSISDGDVRLEGNDRSVPFVVDSSTGGQKRYGLPTTTPTISGGKITYKIAYTWLQELNVGEHHVGFKLVTTRTTLETSDDSMGQFTITN